ncbi:MAG: CvpA family protein [Chloroflexi bacterium]|nr:CvpA family protein [Chloroflexota bacterium]MCI0787963.1 CvpA family protein [Chloroflexota bacterium]MCI0800870.1 CvpA family protein [Chloroflexota bacterium]MCI0828601.1 CvpA family protein [Chloroflexota bacterium]MCI0847293.1 CvpA family protein [Chloroflexota bacterium]
MNWIDIAILVVWGITALWGFSSGLLKILVPLVSLVIGLALSSRIGDSVGSMFSGITDNENAQTVAGFILIMVVLFVAGGIIGFMASKVLGIIPLFGLANSLAGMAAGLLVGFLLLTGVLTGIQRFPFRDLDKTIDESALGTFLADKFDVVIRGVKLIPGDWDDELDKLTN